MITNLILDLVNLVLSGINALLPHFTMPSWLMAGNIIPSGVSSFLGAALHMIAPFFPSAVLCDIFVGVANLWPFFAAYTVAQWIYRHIPTIAGFGIGNG